MNYKRNVLEICAITAIVIFFMILHLENQPKTKEVFSPSSIEHLAKVTEAEAADQGFVGKYLVASVMVNRKLSKSFPNTYEDVVNQEYQFATPADSFSEESLQAVQIAIKYPHKDILYFCAPEKSTNKRFVNCLTECFRFKDHIFCKKCL